MKTCKKLLAFLLCIVLLSCSVFTVTGNAATYGSMIIDIDFLCSTWEYGEEVQIPFTMYNGSSSYQKYYVYLYDSHGYKVSSADGYFSTDTYITNLTITWDPEDACPGAYYVKYEVSGKTQATDDNEFVFYYGLDELEAGKYSSTSNTVYSPAANNLKNPTSAWAYNKGTYTNYSDEKRQYTLRLEEMYVGSEADGIVENENMYNDTPTGDQHWILMKFYLKNNGNTVFDANDIIYSNSFYTSTGASLSIIDTAVFSNDRAGMSAYDLELYPGASGYFWIGILPQQEVEFPYIRIATGFDTKKYEYLYSWLSTAPINNNKAEIRNVNGVFCYIQNGKINRNFTGLAYKADEECWLYIENGFCLLTYTGLVKHNNDLYYVKYSVQDTDFTGVVDYNGKYYFVQNGKVNFNKNGLYTYDDTLYYIVKGVATANYTGIAFDNNVGYLLQNGQKNTTYSGVYNDKGSYYMLTNGKVDSTKSGRYTVSGVTYYFTSGKPYTGLYLYANKWYHAEKGKTVTNFTGLSTYNGKKYLMQNGQLNKTYTGIYKSDKWYYLKNGVIDFKTTTLVSYGNNWYYVKNSAVDFTATTLVSYGKNWYYIKNGVKNNSNTLCYFANKWWHVNGGKTVNDTTLVQFNNKWYYVKNGKVDFTATTLVKYGNNWYYIKNGVKNNSNTLCYFANKWWHVNGGKTVNDTTLVQFSGKWYYVKNGKVDFNATTLVQYGKKWYYIKNGVKNNSNTLCYFANKWYYVKNGTTVNDTTLVQFGGKWYYVKNGKVDFNYSGKVLFNGKYYTVKKGIKV